MQWDNSPYRRYLSVLQSSGRYPTTKERVTMRSLKETIAFRITQLCEERNISVYALAIQCGVDKSTIYSILGEKSNSPEVSSIKKICDGLEITLGQFFNTPEFDALEQEIK